MSYTVMMIAAAGHSTRMGQPKQSILLDGKPVLLRTLLTMQKVDAINEILLIARPEDKADFALMAAANGITKLRHVVSGGDTRQQSVQNGLKLLPAETTLVGIHDGARPLVTPETVEQVIATAALTGAAAVAVQVKDTLKKADEKGVITATVDRTDLWRVQTPQVFAATAYKAAMEAAVNAGLDATDDCRLMEMAGHPVQLVPGLETNLKLTTPEDVLLAQAILTTDKKERDTMRIGHGYDVHRLVEGRPLILGGVTIPHDKGLLGHSDADVLTHAIMDALLGAAALGDIGGLFPDNDPAYAGADSIGLLTQVIAHIRRAGYTVANIDATVLAQQPKLKPHISSMRARLAAACELPATSVSIKATTEEGLGFTGSMEGIAAHAVCLLTK
ncbi:MAG: 2-C-methyl-D-erythritol 2,4-cyclodiphosphate synthase [Ruminococcaceae bacterium]|nr:2-C-methyl-D-erythritol 2,4-cyclodiphosphate synthase [Oscillospiraceae bacterium]